MKRWQTGACLALSENRVARRWREVRAICSRLGKMEAGVWRHPATE